MQKKKRDLKDLVREKYTQIAVGAQGGSCCGCGPECGTDYTVFSEDYSDKEGYVQEADLQLGCGLPTEFAGIRPGDTVVDLGSGAGNDAFIARAEAGEIGQIIGIDMTEAMIEQAQKNVTKLGYQNVSFLLGDIEQIPLEDHVADVVVSNCVFNLVPDKEKAFQETLRILKPGGHFSISDVVIRGDLPKVLQEEAELYAGCVSGAIPIEDYLDIIRGAGFVNLQLQKEKEVELPDSILGKYMDEREINDFRRSKTGIYSINVYAEKPK